MQSCKFPSGQLEKSIFMPDCLCLICLIFSCNRVAIDDHLFSYLNQDSYRLYQCLLYMEIANLFFFFFFTQMLTRRWLLEVSCSCDDTPHGDASMHVPATWKFVRFQCPCRPHCYACTVRTCSLEIREK